MCVVCSPVPLILHIFCLKMAKTFNDFVNEYRSLKKNKLKLLIKTSK